MPIKKMQLELPRGEGTPPVMAAGISWVAGCVSDHGDGFVLKPERALRSLPIEFWNHQMMECDPNDESQLKEFIERWGVPFHPCRNLKPLAAKLRTESGIAETEAHAPVFFPQPKPGQIDEGLFVPDAGSPSLSYISKREAKSAVVLLQTFVEKFVYGIGGWYRGRDGLEIINAAACCSRVLRYLDMAGSVVLDYESEALSGRGLLTSAICNQLIDSFADDAEWKECGCDGCGRVFKRKQPQNENVKPDRDSKYCSERCKSRQVKRNQRAAARDRIMH